MQSFKVATVTGKAFLNISNNFFALEMTPLTRKTYRVASDKLYEDGRLVRRFGPHQADLHLSQVTQLELAWASGP
jgi:hypothetical protein